MYTRRAGGLFAGLYLGRVSAATCTNLLVDDFSKHATSFNNLGGYTSDDGTMKNMTVSGTSLILTPVPPTASKLSPSYMYENLPCQQAATVGYTAISFTMKAPSAGSNFTLEVQTMTSCDATKYTSDWQVVRGLAGETQTVVVPFSGWTGADTNLNAIHGFNWATWTSPTQGHGDEQWQLGDIQLICGGQGGASSSSTSFSFIVSTTVPVSAPNPTSSTTSSMATSVVASTIVSITSTTSPIKSPTSLSTSSTESATSINVVPTSPISNTNSAPSTPSATTAISKTPSMTTSIIQAPTTTQIKTTAVPTSTTKATSTAKPTSTKHTFCILFLCFRSDEGLSGGMHAPTGTVT